MNAFNIVNRNIQYLGADLERYTVGLTWTMKEIEYNNNMKNIRNAINYYDDYVKSNGTSNDADLLKDLMKDVESDIQALKYSIGSHFSTYNQKFGNFDQMFDLMTYISIMLTKSKLAIGVGCIKRCSSTVCKNNCKSRLR